MSSEDRYQGDNRHPMSPQTHDGGRLHVHRLGCRIQPAESGEGGLSHQPRGGAREADLPDNGVTTSGSGDGGVVAVAGGEGAVGHMAVGNRAGPGERLEAVPDVAFGPGLQQGHEGADDDKGEEQPGCHPQRRDKLRPWDV